MNWECVRWILWIHKHLWWDGREAETRTSLGTHWTVILEYATANNPSALYLDLNRNHLSYTLVNWDLFLQGPAFMQGCGTFKRCSSAKRKCVTGSGNWGFVNQATFFLSLFPKCICNLQMSLLKPCLLCLL